MRQRLNPVRSPLQEITEPEPAPPTSTPVQHTTKGKKLSSLLEGSASESDRQLQDRNKVEHQEGSKSTSTVEPGQGTKETPKAMEVGVEIPVKRFNPKDSGEPETRRSTRNTTRWKERLDDDAPPANKSDPALANDPFRKNWKTPLVYPKIGKKKEEVNVDDRDRLRENEFLNDNLIAFYIRFLQDHLERTNPDVAKRVYFFNTYFFATLTNKGSRVINYEGVKKWTRYTDLFSYDYIVVPINQNAHWYVAIICNLPSLALGPAKSSEASSAPASDKESPRQPAKEVQEIPESPEPEPVTSSARISDEESVKEQKPASVSPPSEQARQSFASMTLVEKKNAPAKAEHRERLSSTAKEVAGHEEADVSLAASQGPVKQPGKAKAKSQKKKGGLKLDPGQTAIITFDSLDANRSPTVRLLREYICKEAAEKRNVKIGNPLSEIKGMRAQNIPLQPNYSDCGLYLLAYMENFVRSPDVFITKVLQREMNVEVDWPPLGSGLLRLRMRDFLDQLYQEQASDQKEGFMVDRQPISFLLGPPRLFQENVEEESKKIEKAEPISSSRVEQDAGEGREDEQPLHATDDASDIEDTDMPVLVPTTAESAQKPIKRTLKPTSPEPAQFRSPLCEREVQEIPDSQEIAAPPVPEPKAGRAEKKKLRQARLELASSKRERQRLTTPDNNGAQSHPEPSTRLPRVEIQIQPPTVQVPETPPRKEPKRVRQSPRGLARKD
jgi:Ulp1 family protease